MIHGTVTLCQTIQVCRVPQICKYYYYIWIGQYGSTGFLRAIWLNLELFQTGAGIFGKPAPAKENKILANNEIDSSQCTVGQASLGACYDSFPHSFSSYTLCKLLPHAYYFLYTFLFPSTDFLFFHAQPYCLCIASCTVWLLMHSPAQSAY